MCGGTMRELINLISEYVYDAAEIPEDLLYEFSKKTAKIIRNLCTEAIPDEFWELENYVEAYWRGHKYLKSEDAIQIYQMGQLLSFTNMLSMLSEEKEKEISIEDYAVQLKDKYPIFSKIHEIPGITHKELADAVDMSVSSLSQFITKYKWNGFFQSRAMGREKHYYLTKHGQQLYYTMKDKYEKPTISYRITAQALKMAPLIPAMQETPHTFSIALEQNLNLCMIASQKKPTTAQPKKRMPDLNYEAHDTLFQKDFQWANVLNSITGNMDDNSDREEYGKEAVWKNKKQWKMQRAVL